MLIIMPIIEHGMHCLLVGACNKNKRAFNWYRKYKLLFAGTTRIVNFNHDNPCYRLAGTSVKIYAIEDEYFTEISLCVQIINCHMHVYCSKSKRAIFSGKNVYMYMYMYIVQPSNLIYISDAGAFRMSNLSSFLLYQILCIILIYIILHMWF